MLLYNEIDGGNDASYDIYDDDDDDDDDFDGPFLFTYSSHT